MSLWPPTKPSAIALATGTTSVAMCQLRAGRRIQSEAPLLTAWGLLADAIRERPAGSSAVAHTAPTGASAERAGRMVRQSGAQGHEVCIALQAPDVALQAAVVPDEMLSAPREQWKTMLRFEAARSAFGGECDPDALEVDFWPLPPGNRSGSNVMVASIRKDVLGQWLEFTQSAGLELKAVDVLPCALVRAAWSAARPVVTAGGSHQALWGVLDIGYSRTLLTVALGSCCVYSRHLTVSGDAFTLALVDALNVDYAAAEMIKRHYTPPAEDGAPKPQAAADTAANGEGGALLGDLTPIVHTVLRARVRALAGEIERAFSYPMESYPEGTPSALLLCGGGSSLPGIAPALQQLLGVTVAPLRPSDGFRIAGGAPPRSEEESRLMTCVGLALSDLGTSVAEGVAA